MLRASAIVLSLWSLASPCQAIEALNLLEDPTAWATVGTSADVFTFDEGNLTAKRRTYQSATLLTKGDYENFELRFEFMLKRWCELILTIHAPRNDAYRAGLELVLSDTPGAGPHPHGTGALLRYVAPKSVPIHKDEVWNTCRIRMDWPRLEVELNGEIVQDIDLSTHKALRYKLRSGAIGFRDLLGWGFELRDLVLTPLPDSEGGIELFNGRDLDGWKEVRKGRATWRVEDGVIVGDDGNGYLQHVRPCQDFDLRLYYRSTPTANGGVFFRWLSDDSDRGNEIQILDVAQSGMPSASIYSLARAHDAPIRPGEWNLLQIRVQGSHAVTHLNGVKTAETDRLTKVRPGHITLQMHKENSTIEFKDLVLVSLD